MAKVSGLEGRLEKLAADLKIVSDDVALLKTQLGDAEIPDDAEATLERVEQGVTDLVTSLTPVPPPVTTEPAPVTPPPVSPS